ncbi:hypothetical protein BKP37_06360 [Anaerobacillus alkalilacustris]|uniref:Uncharacterized protein n=1 Tax=Anaerobacillus alkalilacustris TaxID=393763 RepID=A0A1S2LVZ4_9BACI|nr:hypothetical protein [Anaerobacillus alkalilacustris]OIJ16343.1 hypothetical protein BKP37_06360 [Anaerobacillus alkalilacustris]
MPWQHKIGYLLGQPVGISFMDGTGTSGVLCDADGGSLYVMEYLYHTQFAIKHYNYNMIQDINPFPSCNNHHQNYHPVVY